MADDGGRVSVVGLTRRFGEVIAVDGIDLDMPSGEFFSMVGPSGCGKTTTLRMIAGFERPDGGQILLDGVDVAQVPPHRRSVNTVFQSYALFPHLSVAENVAFGLRYQKVEKSEVRSRVSHVLGLVQLGGYEDRRTSQLSGGQQQRVALARAIVRNPTVYLMDEPLSNLDAQLRLQTRTELKRLHRELGTTMVYVTHDQGEAMTLGGRIAVMQRGAIVQIGAPLDLYRQPVNTFVGTFLGSPPMNLIEESRGGTTVTLGVRAEDISVTTAPAQGADEARVLVVEPMGSETLVTLDFRHQRLVARVAGDARFEPGQPAWVHLPPDRVLTFDASGQRKQS